MPSDELVITLQCRTCTGAMFAGTPAFHRVCLLAVAGFDCCSGASFLCRTCLSCGTPSLLTVLALNWWILSLLQCCCIYAKHVSLVGLKVRYSRTPCGVCYFCCCYNEHPRNSIVHTCSAEVFCSLVLTSDYPTCLHFLMKYPAVGDINFFIQKALYLREPNVSAPGYVLHPYVCLKYCL